MRRQSRWAYAYRCWDFDVSLIMFFFLPPFLAKINKAVLNAWGPVDTVALSFEASRCNAADHSHRHIKCCLIICFQHQRFEMIIRIGRSNSNVYSCRNYCLSCSKCNQYCYSLDSTQNVVWFLDAQDEGSIKIIVQFNSDDNFLEWFDSYYHIWCN